MPDMHIQPERPALPPQPKAVRKCAKAKGERVDWSQARVIVHYPPAAARAMCWTDFAAAGRFEDPELLEIQETLARGDAYSVDRRDEGEWTIRRADAAPAGMVAPPATQAAAPFSPPAVIDAVVAAVAHLVCEDGDGLADGKTDLDVIVALRPVLGHFTVADAGPTIQFLYSASDARLYRGNLCSRERSSYALFLAADNLMDFAASAAASSEACVTARQHLVQFGFVGGVELGTDNEAIIRDAICSDVDDLIGREFDGHRFGDTDGPDAWVAYREARLKHWREEQEG